MRYLISVALAVLTLAGCAAPPPAREVPPAPIVAPPPRPTPAPPPLASDWNDWPFTPGNWRYSRNSGSSVANFASGDDRLFTVICMFGSRQVRLNAHGVVTFRTTSLTRVIRGTVRTGDVPDTEIVLNAADPLLDAIAFSRGRFVVEQAGQPPLVLPPYAEIGRVIEDCRG